MTLEGKQVLVTGATGFLGGALALRLAHDGARVRALARSSQKAAFLRGVPNIDVVQGDVTNRDSVRAAVEGCAVVFHVAAAFNSLANQRAVNIDGTQHVAQAGADRGVERLVHVSSLATYGYKLDGDVTEATPLATDVHDPYAVTKIEGEHVVREIGARHGMSYSIIRPGMIYGPKSSMWTRKLFRLARLQPTPFVGDGRGTAYPIYVDDVVELTMLLATHPNAHNEAFNCAPDPAPTWREFLGAYQRFAGHDRWLMIPPGLMLVVMRAAAALAPSTSGVKDMPDFVRLTQRRVTHKMDKARMLLNWSPRVDLETGMVRCAAWLREEGLLT